MYTRPEIDFEELFRQRGSGSIRPPKLPGRRLWLTLLAFMLLVLLTRALALYSDWLWFESLGQSRVLAVRVLAPLALFAGVAAAGTIWLGANWLAALRRGPRSFAGQPVPPMSGPRARRWVAVSAAAIALLLALGFAGAWPTILLYVQRSEFGVVDPAFQRDVGFHVFTVPLLRVVLALAMAWIASAAVGTALIYLTHGAMEVRGRTVTVPRWARAHVLVLLALGALVWSAGQMLSRYELLYPPGVGGLFYGAGYTDTVVRMPALAVQAIAGAVLAGLLLLAIPGRRWLLPVSAIAAIIGLQVALLGVLPVFVQRYGVEPDEYQREEPFIRHAITMTRRAYALDRVQEEAYEPTGALTARLLAENADTIGNVRLWDWRVLLRMFEQLQEIRTYYRFVDVDVDRYEVDGAPRQVMLALRELERSEIRNPTWVNERLQYTHGFGAVVTPVDEVDGRGLAVLWARDIPVVMRPPFDLPITQPRVYFGEAQDNRYVIVGATEDEFDFPAGEVNVRNRYDGPDGVALSSRWRRLLYALRFGDVEILVSDALGDDSRILFHRNILDRVSVLAPFLVLDPDPYIVITPEGRLVWLYDAYTVTDRYPYSAPIPGGQPELGALAGNNYVRNSVKIAIDAYDGRPTFHIVDDADPIVRAWAGVFPTLFAPEPMPDALRRHWRYPEALFRAQATIMTQYHVTEPSVFYNAEDLWAVPTETQAQGERTPVQPYYVTMRLRGSDEPEFLLMLPFSPAGRDLMISWLAARSDPGHYGQLVLYRFAKGSQVDGPQQVENRIDNDTEISAQLTLWSQSGSETIRGNLLVIPIEDALLYVEPLFLQSESGALPELKRVIVASRDEVAMAPTLAEALAALFGGRSDTARSLPPDDADALAPADDRVEAQEPPTARGAPLESDPAGERLEELVRAAQEHELAARKALADGDWAAFGREMSALQRVIDRMGPAVGVPTPAPTPGTVEGGGDAPTPSSAPTPAATPSGGP